MKNLIKILLLTVLSFTFSYSSAFATDWTITINGNKLDTEVKEINNHTLIPLRAVGEALDLTVDYNSASGIVTLEASNENFSSASVWLNSKTGAYMAKISSLTEDCKKYNLNVEQNDNYYMKLLPVEINDRLYVPVRLICDSFSAPIWVTDKTIAIKSCFTDGIGVAQYASISDTITQITPVTSTPSTNIPNNTPPNNNSVETNSSDTSIVGDWTLVKLLDKGTGETGFIPDDSGLGAKFTANGNFTIYTSTPGTRLTGTWKVYEDGYALNFTGTSEGTLTQNGIKGVALIQNGELYVPILDVIFIYQKK